jgi:hypothetical protein
MGEERYKFSKEGFHCKHFGTEKELHIFVGNFIKMMKCAAK